MSKAAAADVLISTLIDLRGRLRLTQGQLAAKLGVATSTVNRWENGDVPPMPQVHVLLNFALHNGARDLAAKLAPRFGMGVTTPAEPEPRAPARTPPPKIHAEVRLAAEDLGVTARALRMALRALLAEVDDGAMTVKELREAMGEPLEERHHPRGSETRATKSERGASSR